jgi:hypothetical protein
MAEASKRRYAIRPGEGYFSAGVTPDGAQVLMGLYCPNLVAFRFDRDGSLIGAEQRPVPFFRGVTPPYDIYDDRIQPMIGAWKDEMGFRPATIRVGRFYSDEYGIGIEDYPSHFHEMLDDPDADAEEKAGIREAMELWDADGQCVLLWGNDYWLDGSGHVVSS